MSKQKIKNRDELVKICQELRIRHQKIGFTSGAFDLLHVGHVDFLEKAKALCDVLIVGLNSDASVHRYKGPNRPIVAEQHRMKIIAALEAVDYVFLFDERRNQKNIEILKPDLYIKAGDYKSDTLTSREIVEKYGGEVSIIPIEEEISTSDIIRIICDSELDVSEKTIDKENAVHVERRPKKAAPAVFLDRDGTINEEIGYLHDPKKFKLLPNVIEGIKRFQDMGYRLVIISNQPGIGLGYYPEEDFYRVNRVMMKAFSEAGISIDKIYYCPHSQSEGCNCRKPGQLFIKRAQQELNVDLTHSMFIGDKTTDMETGRRAGMRTVLVQSGFNGEDEEYPGEPDYRAKDLLDAANWVLQLERSSD
ncbi:HAD-IIIA family hydrolase [bacterium]|nr:HAD-IIIA family hydrolase [bacterium]